MTARPSFTLTTIFRRRDRIYRQVLQPLVGQIVDGRGLDQLAAAIRKTLPADVTPDSVFESVRYIAGQPVTDVLAYQVAWRLAGNIPRLREGKPVTPWSVQHEDEWVPVQVMRCFSARDSRDRAGHEFSFQVLAGTPCPMLIRSFWRSRVIRYVAYRVGFSSSWNDYPFQRPEQLVGLRFLAYIQQALSRSLPEFHEIECPQSLVSWNREHVLRLRLRVKGQKCPQGWRHECHRCAIGYEECPAGTHALNYTVGNCNQCGNANAPFDPEEHGLYCITCNQRNRLRRPS